MAAITFKNFDNCCRTCLNDVSNKMYDIFAEKSDSVTVNAADMLSSCTALKVGNDDNLPKKLCGSCYNCLISFYDFRKLAEKVDFELRSQIEKNIKTEEQKDSEIIDIKLERDSKSAEYEINVDDFEPDSLVKIEESININPYYCNICLYDLNNFADFKEHCKIHADNEKIKLKCEFCDKKFRKVSKLEQHRQKHTKNELYTCSFCSETFKHHFKYVKHLVTHGKVETQQHEVNQNDTDQRLECDICSSHFKSMNSLAAHMRKHVEKNRVLACSICDKIFKKVSHLKRHELCHEINRPYKCLQCPKRFNSDILLKEHLNKHSGIKPHACPMCPKSFAHLSTLTAHVKIHTRQKPFLCPTCGKKFDSSTNLNQHLRRHMGLKIFACNLCPRKFVSKGELKSHTKTHTGERSFTCDECGSSFTSRSSLAKHKLRHAGIKPHQCDACAMKFVTKDHLKRHYRIHTGEKPYQCDICDRAFTQSNDLVKHRRAHLGEKLYKCTECSEAFRLHSELRQHISAHFITTRLVAKQVKQVLEQGVVQEIRGSMNGNEKSVQNSL